MPLFFQQQVNAHTRLAVWEIAEAESFFLQHVPLQQTITHPHKRLQHLAGRYLLKFLFPQFPLALIKIAGTRKPFLADELFHFSISHCGSFAAVLVSQKNRVGVDVEISSDRVVRLQHKFLSVPEREVLKLDDAGTPVARHCTLAWSCKEAAFKWYGAGKVDFKQDMILTEAEAIGETTYKVALHFKKNEDRLLDLHSIFFNDLCVSCLLT